MRTRPQSGREGGSYYGCAQVETAAITYYFIRGPFYFCDIEQHKRLAWHWLDGLTSS